MRKNLIYLAFFFALSIVFINGCSKDDSGNNPVIVINESEELAKYVESSNDYIYSGGAFVISASDFRTAYNTNPARVYIIDIRSTTDYNAKRLKGAVNVTLGNLLTHIKGLNFDNYDKIVVACYSGQTAAYGVSLVRSVLPLAQGNKVVSLKWGMSSIDSTFATNYWLAKRSNIRAGNFVTTDPPTKPTKGSLPTITTGKKTGKEILEARVDSLLAAGFSPALISDATVFANLANYFVANYWTLALYKDPGHIDGSFNYDPTPKPFKLDNDLKTLPTNKTVVLYCFTGQTSAYVGAYLRLLGYDARSLAYGANAMIYDVMLAKNVANTFIPANEIKGYKDLLEP